jgi:hypothetical protein
MMNTPLVSVLMTSYNSEKYIGEAIESVLNSTFSDFDLIICISLYARQIKSITVVIQADCKANGMASSG